MVKKDELRWNSFRMIQAKTEQFSIQIQFKAYSAEIINDKKE
jgi:hypothetical protein